MIRIITDSAADLAPWEYEQKNIFCIPLGVSFGDKHFQENADLDKEQFYSLLLGTEQPPKTSQPTPQALMDIFEDAQKAGDEVIYITISSAISGTYQNASMVRDMVGHPGSYVTDGRIATGGQRLIVEYAAKLRDEGKTAQQIVEAIEKFRGRIQLWACMDTLEYLYKGGRISQTTYRLGTLANIKPIITFDTEGNVAVPAKAMGTRKGMDYLCKRVQQKTADPAFPFYVMYTSNLAPALELKEKLEALGMTIPQDRVIQVGAAIGSHIGPNACGLVYVSQP